MKQSVTDAVATIRTAQSLANELGARVYIIGVQDHLTIVQSLRDDMNLIEIVSPLTEGTNQ
jgi:hypothetical protein